MALRAVRGATPQIERLICHGGGWWARRGNVVAPALYAAVLPSVEEINEQSDDEPDDQPRPCCPTEAEHHQQRYRNPHDRSERNPRRHESPWDIGPPRAQNPNSATHNDERE